MHFFPYTAFFAVARLRYADVNGALYFLAEDYYDDERCKVLWLSSNAVIVVI